MSSIASRDLRNHTADVLRRVQAGDTLLLTVHGQPVAQISPVAARRRTTISKRDLVALLSRGQADPGLRTQLHELVADTTDDLGPLL